MKKALLMSMAVLFTSFAALAQRVVTGTISDEAGSTLPGVNVLVKGSTNGTTTDLDGNFRLSVPENGGTLVFRFIGFESQEVEIGAQSVINVTLSEDVTELSEVVVVGYGTQIKQDLTGNVAQVSGEDIENIPVPSFEQAIQGRTAGVQITSQNGKVGGGINIRVRGASSISASNEPLYVVDGIPITTDNQSLTSAATNPLSDINFNDIASIEILKDASSAAIYGSRGSNGVVLITTKQGKAGKTQFNFNAQFGFSKPTRKRDFINAGQYIELFREAAYNNDLADGFDPINNPDDYAGSWLEYMEGTFDYLSGHVDWREEIANNPNWEGTDWQEEAFQDASVQSYDLSARGGSDNTRFFFSGSVTDQDGILIGNSFQRISGRLNLDHDISEKLTVGVNVGISRSLNNRVTDDNAFSTPLQLIAQAPITPVRDEEGNLYDNTVNPAMFYYPATMEEENSDFTTTVFRNLVNTSATYDVVDGLSITGEYGFDLLTQLEQRYQNSVTEAGLSVGGYGQDRWVRIFNYTSRLYANYSKVFDVHSIDFTLGTEFQKSTRHQTLTAGQGYPLDELKTLSSAAEVADWSGTLNEYSFLSYFGRLNYKLQDKYLLGVSGRMDASSRFGENNRYGFFPAASVGWIISNEGFLGSSDVLSFLKLRASYGLTGNAGIGNYDHFGTYVAAGYNGQSALIPSQIPNPDLEWEKTAQVDIGVDFGLFGDRLSGELDYYKKNTTDLLLNVPVLGTSGFSTQTQNIGELQNSGVEVVLNYDLIKGSAFSWSTSLNYAANQNKVTKLYGDTEQIGPTSSRYMNAIIVGEAIGVHYGVEFAGANPENGDAIFYLNRDPSEEELNDGSAFTVDHLGDRYVTDNYNLAESKVLGNPNPDFIYGWTNNFKFKGFDLSILIQGQEGNKVFLGGGTFMTANARYEDNQTADQLDRWQQPGDITDVPQARLYANNGAQTSSRYLSDASYVRLKTLTFGYNFPRSILGNSFISSARVYFSGQNLITITDYDGWDPEVNTDYLASNIFLGNDFYSAPQAKTFTFGVKLGF
ncbi:SusC/RagA family TonB-linked outer membrane protein [Marinoscillum pacificum]|uniref:SusC/RagA family TonB-linked outer membrane protein n=1 Tax=Marinoscillum pacificum TaxID=392723 RepID=UPI002158312E|nr:TonB-dependent receptor [Marinoscillum pacificum]